MGFKDLKAKYLVETATKLFLERNIAEVTIKDIASEAEIGEATIYRYFTKKQNIVLAVSLSLKEKVFQVYFDLSKGKTGFEKVEIFYNSYLNIFKNSPEYFYFRDSGHTDITKENNPTEYEKFVNKVVSWASGTIA